MPSFTGRFERLAPGEGAIQSGPCELSFDDRTVTIVPVHAAPLAFDLGDIDTLASGDCEIRLSLYTGHDVRLTHFARAFQDLERQLLEAYRDRLVQCLLVSDLDEVARFGGHVRLESPVGACSGPAEIRLYESNLAILPDAAPGFQWRLADVDAVEFDAAGYGVVFTRQEERLTVARLAKRTGELAERVQSRRSALSGRTARVLHALFPFLTPGQFTAVSALLRDGSCAPASRLADVHPSVGPVLVEKVVDRALEPYAKALAGRTTAPGWYAGLKIIRRELVEDAEGAEEAVGGGIVPGDERDPIPAGRDSRPDDGVVDVGDGLEVIYWFFYPLGIRHEAPSHVAWEATSRGGRATYLFRLGAAEPVNASVLALNRGLVAVNFRREPLYLEDRKLEAELRYRHYAIAQRKLPDLSRLRRVFVGRAIHSSLAGWSQQIDSLVSR